MSTLIQLMLGVGSLAAFGWLVFSGARSSEAPVTSQDDVIDLRNSYQIGFLMGMTGGTVTDAAVIRHALERFEHSYGYKATLRDAATVVGLMNTIHN